MIMFNKIVSSVIITSQLAFAGGAWAAPAASTPEFKLLESSIALAGKGLSQDELNGRAAAAFANYEKIAQPDGQLDRMEQAMVDLNLYTPDQAHQLTLDARNFASQTRAPDLQSANQAVASEMSLLVSRYPSGAQFSACELFGTLAISGFVVGTAGGVVWSLGAQSTCGPYGADCRNEPEVKAGIILTGLGVLALIDGFVIMGLAPNGC